MCKGELAQNTHQDTQNMCVGCLLFVIVPVEMYTSTCLRVCMYVCMFVGVRYILCRLYLALSFRLCSLFMDEEVVISFQNTGLKALETGASYRRETPCPSLRGLGVESRPFAPQPQPQRKPTPLAT